MRISEIDLGIDYTARGILEPKKKCRLIAYELPVYGTVTDIARPAVIICPGGGYRFISEREGEPVASAFLAEGINAYILEYTCADDGCFPAALLEAFTAVRYVREHAAEKLVNPERVFLCGFSAGGHCAAAAGTMWELQIAQNMGFFGEGHRPDGLILGYPVITAKQYAHEESFRNLLGAQDSSELREFVSLENRVSERTPRTFLWHTANDGSVPVQNSILFAKALADHGVPFEMHVYPSGEHGLSTARYDVLTPGRFRKDPYMLQSVPTWVHDAIRFIKE